MSLLSSDEYLAHRRAVTEGPLRGLADSLNADLSAVIARPLFIPEQKALLSREGGRCPRDGTMLEFDPFSPHDHRCPRCGEAIRGELHDGFWVYWYQLWLAERAVHSALLGALGVNPEGREFAARVIAAYVDRYPRYPNVDNALGPTRPFFSTYLESIWLLQLCIAASLLDEVAHGDVLATFRDVIVEPSAALIESFDEGASNRQVWNNAALLAADLTLGRTDRAERRLESRSGIAYHLKSSLLEDGTWYEGENYHLFAHRGLWYAVQMCEAAGFELPPNLIARYERGFAAPFLTSLPDLTFPSRRDSQYAISLRQWRFAEWCELGLARNSDRVLQGILSRLYENEVAPGDTGRWKSSAEAERNLPPVRLTRDDLGWKSLLFAESSFDVQQARALPSVLLDAQGIGVLRRDQGRVYAALDYGVSGGGHGHPDRLNLLLMNGDRRLLDDMGTGSYVDPSLHWYRSSLAHNAPFFDGRSQPRTDGKLIAFEDRGAAGWICAYAFLGEGFAQAIRAVVMMPDYLVDHITWGGDGPSQVDLPVHADLSLPNPRPALEGTLDGSQGLEDGFRFVSQATLIARTAANETIALTSPIADVWIGGTGPLEVWKVVAPGAPGKPEAPFILLRGKNAGAIRSVWSWKKSVEDVTLFPEPVVQVGAERHEHAFVEHGWRIAVHVNGAKSSIDLEGLRQEGSRAPLESRLDDQHRVPLARVLRHGESAHEVLGETHYRRSESTWRQAGSPRADFALTNDRGRLRLSVDVHAERSFVPPDATNRLDNEHPDINGAGLQVYMRSGSQKAAWVVVPISGSTAVSMRPIDGWGDSIAITGAWRETAGGYRVELQVESRTPEIEISLAVNEKPLGRERRRGQLFFPASPSGSNWIYLRGDRPAHDHMIPLRLELD
jgi:hypothetical protein